MRKQNYSFYFLCFLMLTIFAACQKDEYTIPSAVSGLTNDCIKRTLGPNIVSLPIEFAYAMAIPKVQGKLVSAQVEASIAGATGTYLEYRSFYTNTSGVDVPVTVGTPSVTDGKVTKMTFTVDTIAATLRYFYIIPEEARGKTVSFTFSATSSDGKTVSYVMGPYTISRMDIKKTWLFQMPMLNIYLLLIWLFILQQLELQLKLIWCTCTERHLHLLYML